MPGASINAPQGGEGPPVQIVLGWRGMVTPAFSLRDSQFDSGTPRSPHVKMVAF